MSLSQHYYQQILGAKMAAPAPAAATMADSVTAIVAQAGEAAGNSLVDSGFAWIDRHPMAGGIIVGISVGIVVARMALPGLQRWAAGTSNKVDDRAVAVLRWLVGAVAGRIDDRQDQ